VIEKTGILQGLGPEKSLDIAFVDDKGAWHTSRIPMAKGLEARLNDALGWIGKTVKASIDKGEIESLELVE